MDRLGYIFRRLLQLIPVAFGVTLICFFMIHLIPGDPAADDARRRTPRPRRSARLHKQWGLDQPLIEQYLDFMNRLLHGDLGDSLFYGLDVRTLLIERIGPTLWLLGMTTIFAVIIAVPLATLAATQEGRQPRPGGPRRADVRAGHAALLGRDHPDPAVRRCISGGCSPSAATAMG